MFPQGGPGLALLLLRISVAATFLIEAIGRSTWSSSPILIAGILLISISLAIGFLTPVLSVIVSTSAAVALLIGLRQESFVLVSLILNSAALALLGPGAYSVDARLFGRRVMVVPPRTGTHNF
jgi:uncharacterized membrane protein YphA (DoxX/SURF4 family)